MATWTSNKYDGRYLQLTITESVNTAANTSTLYWTLQSIGGAVSYYTIDTTTVKINGTQVYNKGRTAWDDRIFPAAKGSTSGSITVPHNSDGSKSITVVFSTRVYYYGSQDYGGSLTLSKIDRTAPSVSISVSNVTASSVKIAATSSAAASAWWYSTNGGSNWVTFSGSSTRAEKTITGLTPNTNYSLQVCARKSSNGVDGYSSKRNIKTLGGSVFSSVNTFTADSNPARLTFSATVYNTGYTHTLTIKNGGSTVLTISGLKLKNGSNTLTLTEQQRGAVLSAMSNIKSFNGSFTLATYSGSAQIGDATTARATVKTTEANSAPGFTGFTYKDTNATVTAVTGNNQIIVQNISALEIKANAASPRNGATISSYSAVAGNATASSVGTVIKVGKVSTDGKVPIIVTAVDSRGYTASATINITVIKYEGIDIAKYLLRRINEVEDTTQAEISGNIVPVKIDGANKNGLKYLKYRAWKTSDSPPPSFINITEVTHNDNSFKFTSAEWISLDADYSYYVQFVVADKMTSDEVVITLPQGTPLLAFRRKRIGVNKREPAAAVDVNGAVMMNGFNILGIMAALGDTEDLNSLTSGGIYTQALNANADTNRHYPKNIAGFLEVIPNSSGYIMQRYTAYDNSAVYIRTRYNGTWYAWKSIALNSI